MTSAYPLAWPQGWPRGDQSKGGGVFKTTYDKSMRRFYREMEMLNAQDVVVSSNIPLRLDGQPRGDIARRIISDPGVAVFFTLRGKPMVMARDAYSTAFDNFHSLVLAVEALRAMERHGGATMMERAFEGFTALPEPGNASHLAPWWKVLRFEVDPSGKGNDAHYLDDAEMKFRTMAKAAHADTGGTHELMIVLNAAIAQARKVLGE